MLDFRVETFLAVCETMNFTRAAERLHITQPAVSQHIHALETQYGTRLFVYEGKQLRLTESGQLFLQTAATSETASQETIDSAMNAIAAMANWSMLETQLENTLLAKDFSDCVVYISEEGVTVSVPAPADGLSEAAVARITEAVTSAGYTADQLTVIEIRSGSPAGVDTTAQPGADAGTGTPEDSEALTELAPET